MALWWSGLGQGGGGLVGWLVVVTRRALDDFWVIYELWHNFSMTDIGEKEQRKRQRESQRYNEQNEKWKRKKNKGWREKWQKEGNEEIESVG